MEKKESPEYMTVMHHFHFLKKTELMRSFILGKNLII